MDPAKLPGLRSHLGEPRFARYLRYCAGKQDQALRLYSWNLEISAAFWGPISVLEVALRNALHRQLVARCGRDDWWSDSRLLDVLCPHEQKAISSSLSTLAARGIDAPTADDVVAATSFGLWVGLTGEGLPRDRRYSYETSLWQPRLKNAFPHLGDVRRKAVHDDLDRIRVLRNRIAHHEAIFTARHTHLDLSDRIVRVAGYLDPDVASYITGSSRIEHVLDGVGTALRDGSSCSF